MLTVLGPDTARRIISQVLAVGLHSGYQGPVRSKQLLIDPAHRHLHLVVDEDHPDLLHNTQVTTRCTIHYN